MNVGNKDTDALGEAIEAGDNLIDALDDAFAEFGDETFDFESSSEDEDNNGGGLGHTNDQSKYHIKNQTANNSTSSPDPVPRTINAVDQIISPLQMPHNAKLFSTNTEPVYDSSTQYLCGQLESTTIEDVVSKNNLISDSMLENDNTLLSSNGSVTNKQQYLNEDEDSDVDHVEDNGSNCSSFDEGTEFCRSLIDFSNSKKPLDPINEDDDFADDSVEDLQIEIDIPEEEDKINIERVESEKFLRKEEVEIQEDTIDSKEVNCDEFEAKNDPRNTYSEEAHRLIPMEGEEEKKCELSDFVHIIASEEDDGSTQSSCVHAISCEPLAEGIEPSSSSKTGNLPTMRSSKLAQSNAEDVLDLSLEIQNLREQLKQSLEEKSKIHLRLNEEISKTAELEKELQQQRINFVEAKESYCVDVQELMIECQQARIRIQAAEEDAENALDLAKSSDASRVEMEEYLQRSLDEIEKLRSEAQFLPKILEDTKEKSVQYNKVFTSPRQRSNRQKAIVSVGRNLLRQVVDNDDGSVTSTQDGSLGGSTIGSNSNSHYSALSRRSTDKRRRLIERLNHASDEFSPSRKGGVVVFSPNGNAGGLDLSYTGALSTTLKNIGQSIRQSGKAIGLGGRWFSKRSRLSKKGNGPHQEEMDIENMTKSYCKSTESLIMKQNLALKEMKSFCDYLEEKVASKS